MAMVINTNLATLNAQRNLAGSAGKLATSMERLSSGLRINSAKDDAAGLAISSRMTTQITGLNVAQRNANDGISLAQTAEGALSSIGNNLQRIRELAVQSRNATNSDEDRAALQKEVTQLTSEIDRVAKNTSFNGTNLLDGSFTKKSFQVGANQGQLIEVDSIVNANVSQLGAWKSVDVPAELKGTEIKANNPTPASMTQTGAFTAAADAAATGTGTFTVGGVDIINRAVTTTTKVTAAEIDTALLAKKDALKAAGISFTGTAAGGNLSFAKASGEEFTVAINAAVGSMAGITAATTTNGTTAYPGFVTGAVTIQVGAGAAVDIGAIGEATSKDDFEKKVTDAIASKFADGSVKASFVNGSLTLTSDVGDITIGGSDPSKLGLSAGAVAKFTAGSPKNGFKDVDISTVAGSDNAILAMDAALKAVNSARADLGAIQNRFESVVSNLATTSENLTASRSRILDADFAVETANLSSAQVLQQAGTAMVAQANQLPQNVLSLLR